MDIGGILVDGRPDANELLTMMGRINDWYWGGNQQNCLLHKGGIILASRHIKKGEQLCMSYGADYCWDTVKLKHIKQLSNNIKQIAKELCIEQFDDKIEMFEQRLLRLTDNWRNELEHDKLGPLLKQYADGIPDDAQHPFSIEALEDNFERWVERVVRSRSWQKRYRFGNWKSWAAYDWAWLHIQRDRRRHKHPRKCHNDAVDWVETTGVEELIPLNEHNLHHTTGRWTGEDYRMDGANACDDSLNSDKDNCVEEQSLPETELRCIVYNVGGLSDGQEIELLHTMKTQRIDYAGLVDTRTTEEATRYLRQRIRQTLGPQYKVAAICIPQRASAARRVGGQLHIYRADVIEDMKFHAEDQRGALAYADFKYGTKQFRMVTTYLPNANEGEESLWTATGGPDSHNMLLHAAEAIIRDAKIKEKNIIYGGDFNMLLEGKLHECIKGMELTPTGNTDRPSWRNAVASSRIDFVFHWGNDITEAWGGPREMATVLTDHYPILGVFRVPTARNEVQAIRFQLQPDLKRGDKKAAENIRIALQRLRQRDNPNDDIRHVTTTTVRTWRKLHKKRSSRRWVDGWSPDMMAHQYAIWSLTAIRRHLYGEANAKVWTARDYRRGRNAELRRWKNLLGHLANRKPETAKEQLTQWLEDPVFTYVTVRDLDENEMRKTVDLHIWRAKQKNHGRARTEMRMRISDRIRRREESRQAGKLRPVLESMLGPYRKRKEGYTMETLRINEQTKTDPKEIHDVLTKHFQEWFATPEGNVSRVWEVHGDCHEFIERNAHLNVPDDVLATIWTSLQTKAEEDQTLLQTPTIEEFNDAINHMAKDSAPGLTGLSYNMMKVWDDDTRLRIYNDILTLWNDGCFPEEWKDRWLVPIPKKPDPDISDLRPLTLMDALRKTWGSIFVRRIQKKWADEHLLQPNQYGSVKGKGTDGAVAEFLNAAETAKERSTPLYITSWDIRRAFDSVDRQLVTLALQRLGVPEALTAYLRAVDDGVTIVRTPWALQCVEEGLEVKGFKGERGIGQGDVISPLIWTAFFDILLTALARIKGGINTSSRHGYLRETSDVAYVDDLISVQGDPESLQRKADIVSGFCIWAGLTLATDKFRAFAINWGNGNIAMGNVIVIHSNGWKPINVHMKTDGNLKHLGVIWDMDLSNETQRSLLTTYLRESLAYVSAKRASSRCKIIAITKCIIPKVLYTCKFMGWTLVQYKELEKIVSAALRKAAKLLPGFPTDLLYMSKQEGGLGYDSLVDIVHRTKHRMYQRLLDTSDLCLVASGLLARAFRARGQILQPHVESVLHRSSWSTAVWATSLVQWREENGATLVATGIKEDEDVEDMDEVIRQGASTGLYTRSERVGGNVRLRVGQFWTTEEDGANGDAIEIVAVNRHEVHALKWRTNNNTPVGEGSVLWARPATHGDGTGPDGLAGHPADLVSGLSNQPYLLSVTGDRHTRHGGEAINECTVTAILRRGAVLPAEPEEAEWVEAGPLTTVYTDGTYARNGTITEWASGRERMEAAAGVVISGDAGDTRFRIAGEVQMTSAYDAEVVALAVAGRMIRNTTIYSDCQAAISSVNLTQHRTGIAQVLRIADGQGEVQKVAAHAERRKQRSDWTPEELGNVKADAAAAGREDEHGNPPEDLSIRTALKRVTPHWWINRDGLIEMDVQHTTRSDRYVQKRDGWRRAGAREPRWTGVTHRLAAQMWKGQECSWATAVRIMWDKHVTGENERKWGCREVTRCPVCDAVTSQRHIIRECQRPGAEAIRRSAAKGFRDAVVKHGHTLVGRTLTAIQDLMVHDDAHTIWTGMWTPAIREQMEGRCPWMLTRREFTQVKRALSVLVGGVLQLYRLATPANRKRAREPEPMHGHDQQTRIDNWATPTMRDRLEGIRCEGVGRDPHRSDEREFDARRYDR